MVALALDLPGVFGARMTGAKRIQADCTINLVESVARRIAFSPSLDRQESYQRETGVEPEVYICQRF